MSRDGVASCSQHSLGDWITCAFVDLEEQQLYIVPFESQSISVWIQIHHLSNKSKENRIFIELFSHLIGLDWHRWHSMDRLIFLTITKFCVVSRVFLN
jgi:hypothetical protein